VPLGECRLDLRLCLSQQVERGVKLVLVDVAEAEHGAERVGGGGFAELPGRREFGGGLDHPRDDHGERQPGQPHRLAGQQPVEAELARHPEHGGNVAMRQGALDADLLGRCGEAGLTFQYPAQGFDLVVRPVGQIGQRA
jgi:hypothetical protein